MQSLYLTPASIGYLAQFILSLVISLYLIYRFGRIRNHSTQILLLTGFFCVITLFVGLLFFDAALLPMPRLYIVYLENTILGIALTLLIQFAYHFPTLFPRRKWESYTALGLSLLYTLYEAQYAVYRFSSLLGQTGTVEYRPPQADYALVAIFIWVPISFLRQSISADERRVNWLRKLSNPQGLSARGARSFAFLYIPLIILGTINILRGTLAISTTTYNIFLSLGILTVLFLFATVYLNYQPESTSFLVKLSGITLTLLLFVLGVVGWVVTPDHVNAYQATLADHQTLHFTPNASGGYDVAEVPFTFETDQGNKLSVTSRGDGRNQLVNFDFPFHGKRYHEIYVTSVGLLGMGQKLYHPNLQNDYGTFPGIFPLLVDLEPEAGGGVFARVEQERLIVTWDHLPAFYNEDAVFTFQAVLYQDGSFDFTYNGLPDPLVFNLDATPSANPWIRGETSGGAVPPEQVMDLSQPMQGKPQGIVQDFYTEFRHYLHHFIAPVAWLLLGSSLLIILGFPIGLHSNLVKPLKALLAGIKKVEGGDLSVNMPIQHHDEIGSLTSSFNAMASQLRKQVNELEEHVEERTQELKTANTQLKVESHERESVEMQNIQQQRDIAAAEERDQMARDLHDGFGQALGFVNVQAQAVQAFLKKNQVNEAQENLENLVQVVRDAHVDLRRYILGLRDTLVPQRSFYETLQTYLNAFHQAWGIETVFSPPLDNQSLFPEMVEDQLLHIVQEALVNIRKHAEARRVEVLVTFLADKIVLIVRDDGRGFDTQLAPAAEEKHFGLSIMRERAEQIGGQVEIRSIIGSGTQVLISIPHISTPTSNDEQISIHKLRILLADDQSLFLDGMRNLLTAHGLTVIGAVRDGLQAMERVRALRPDVVLMDIQMPNCDGIEATRLIKAEFPEIKVVLLTVSEDEDQVLDAIKYGASGYLLKSMDANEIISMLGKVMRGETQIASRLTSHLLTEINRNLSTPRTASFRAETVPVKLTVRQWEVLRLVARGLTYKEAGVQLSLTERAIKYHMAQILERLQLKNREQVIAYVRQFQEARQKNSF
jgi:signal transduction histidine kinase/DNA-binding NarL/FixJ family response regulator